MQAFSRDVRLGNESKFAGNLRKIDGNLRTIDDNRSDFASIASVHAFVGKKMVGQLSVFYEIASDFASVGSSFPSIASKLASIASDVTQGTGHREQVAFS
jgi:hypothetical protein